MKELALKIIHAAFKDRKDKGGFPYVEHCKWVADNSPEWDGGDCKIAALLHDLLEDCPEWNEKSLRALFPFPTKIIDTVVVLTKLKSEKYEAYIQRIIDSENRWAIAIKKADLRHNMDLTRLPILQEKDFERLAKYHRAYTKLVDL